MKILAIETSCDDTTCAILKTEDGYFHILSNVVSSQIKLHSEWGGVVPNLAAREHLKNIIPVIEESLKVAGVSPPEIDLLAVTNGPGLIPALLVGTTTAKTLSYLWQKPLIGIHHIEGHIYANFIREKQKVNQEVPIANHPTFSQPSFPILCLVVSGGHTQLVLMKDHLNYEIVGETLDDAVGEAFDKVARIVGLGYPGGPIISKRARLLCGSSYNLLEKKFPRPMINSGDFNFSFSGLKTAVLYTIRKNKEMLANEKFVNEICHEFQEAVVEVLTKKTLLAAQKHQPKTIIIAGGVSANIRLREELKTSIAKKFSNQISFEAPELSYSIDNAAMIASAAYWRYRLTENKSIFDSNWKNLKTDSNLKLENLRF
jgi:N6-L-threonylcarbamoyladenine synthase